MRRQSSFCTSCSLGLLLLTLALSSFGFAKQAKSKKEKPVPPGTPVLWREPTDIETRNLLSGEGGEAMKPDLSKVTLIRKEQGGYSTKYRVRDGSGHEWVAKIGKESQAETAASRLMWAIGYFPDINYLVPSVRVEGLDKPLENVRFGARPKEFKRIDMWKWEDNPFIGKPEFQGLKIMMVLINNWDIKDSNNKIRVERDEVTGVNELQYFVSDLGGSLGKTGGMISRSRNNPSDFEKATFVELVKGDKIAFHYAGKNKKLFADITLADVKWLSGWLGRLSDEQIKDAFRAANYSPEEVEGLARAMRERINSLVNIAKAA